MSRVDIIDNLKKKNFNFDSGMFVLSADTML